MEAGHRDMIIDYPTDEDMERLTAEAAAEAQRMIAALDLEQLQRETLEAAAQMERELCEHEPGSAGACGDLLQRKSIYRPQKAICRPQNRR